jgi:hypothetical protein
MEKGLGDSCLVGDVNVCTWGYKLTIFMELPDFNLITEADPYFESLCFLMES